jgi:hypothetical protein
MGSTLAASDLIGEHGRLPHPSLTFLDEARAFAEGVANRPLQRAQVRAAGRRRGEQAERDDRDAAGSDH